MFNVLANVQLYAIKVDYYTYSEEKGQHTVPMFVSIDLETKRKDGTCVGLITFTEDIEPGLRYFKTIPEAEEYIEAKVSSRCCLENPRVVEITYNFNENYWTEVCHVK